MRTLQLADVESRVVAALRAVLPPRLRQRSITAETRLEELGVDSLKLLQFLLGLEDEFGLRLDANVLKQQALQTVSDAVSLVSRRGQA